MDQVPCQARKSAEEQAVAIYQQQPNSTIVLRGLSGMGKTTTAKGIVERIGEDDIKIIDDEVYRDTREISKISDGIRSGAMKAIICVRPKVSQEGTPIITSLGNVEHDIEYIDVATMTDEEIERMATTINPRIEKEQLKSIVEFSLGIPLLVSNMSTSRDVTRKACMDYLRMYLNQEFTYRIKTKSPETIVDIIKTATGRDIPKEFLEEIALSLGKSSLKDSYFIHPPLFVEYPIPISERTSEVYRELGEECDCVRIRIFTKGVSREIVTGELGFSGYQDFDNAPSRIGLFSGTLRKTSANFKDRIYGSESPYAFSPVGNVPCPERLKINMDGFEATLRSRRISTGKEEPVLFETHDHTELNDNQMKIGYALETYFQGVKIPYVVSYGYRKGKEWILKTFVYNPETQKLEEVENLPKL